MQLPEKVREVTTGGVTESSAFQISQKDQAHIKSILRDNIYSDKILAVLREYSANAWDAHRMVGKGDLPIEVQVPTWDNLTLVIKDFGPGLSHDDVFGVFTQYGASTKRNTNDAVGMLGIGSKSGFAYSDTFTIISRHGGKKRTYVAMLDEADNDALNLLGEEDCGDDTGLTIQIAVRKEDMNAFQTKARNLFQHFVPRPKINIDLPYPPAIRSKLTHGIVFNKQVSEYEGSQWYALMGCVPYKVDLDQLRDSHGNALVSQSFRKTSGLLQFNIGEVQVNASREGLKYSNLTKDALVKKFTDLLDEFVTVVLDEIEKGDECGWEKRLKALTLLNLGLGKDEVGDWGQNSIDIDAKTFKANRHSIPVKADFQIVRHTNIGKKKLKDFDLGGYYSHVLIEPALVFDLTDPKNPVPVWEKPGIQKTYTWDEVNAELEKFLKDNQLDGIKIVDLHTCPWTSSSRTRYSLGRPRTIDPKHSAKMFRLESLQNFDKASKRWAIDKREAQAEDVFVILDHFETTQLGDIRFITARKQDIQIAEAFGLTLPEIYGYKTTEKKPLTPDKVTGIHYPEWRKKWLSELPADKLQEFVEIQAWINHANSKGVFSGAIGAMVRGMDTSHPIMQHFIKALGAKKKSEDRPHLLNLLIELGIVQVNATKAAKEFSELEETYPLLKHHGFFNLWGKNATHWHQYVQLIDLMKKDVPAVTLEVVTEPVSFETITVETTLVTTNEASES